MRDASISHPYFMIIGAAKAGTSSLHAYMQRHHQVFMTTPKEPEFFSRREFYARGVGEYCDLYKGAEGKVTGEASTTYTRWPHTEDSPRLIYENVRTSRFIYLMRNPVDRAFSHYLHHMRAGFTMTFEEALKKDNIYFDCGNYYMQIERYLRFYELDSFLFVFQDELKAKPLDVLRKIERFLGLEPCDYLSGAVIEKNVRSSDYYLRSRTTQRLRKLPLASAVIDVMPREWKDEAFRRVKKSWVGRSILSSYALPTMRPDTRRYLEEMYREPNRRLANLLNVDLESWNQ